MNDNTEIQATLSLYGEDAADKFSGYSIGETCVFLVTGSVASISKDSVSLDISDVELKAHAASWDDAVKRAKNEVAYKNRLEPAIG